jgi:hypothetical protein
MGRLAPPICCPNGARDRGCDLLARAHEWFAGIIGAMKPMKRGTQL